MAAEPDRPVAGREVRLLAVTIGISILALLLLARLRFPADNPPAPAQPPASAALERLAARATYDELAAIIDDVQRRVTPTMLILSLRRDEPLIDVPVDAAEIGVTPPRHAIALRLDSTTAVAPFWPGTRIEPLRGGENISIVAVDERRQVMVLRVPAGPAAPAASVDSLMVPAYLTVAESTRVGPALRPVFVSRADAVVDSRWSSRQLAMGQLGVQSGSFVFSLSGESLGLVLDTPDGSMLIEARTLSEHATRLQREGSVRRGRLGFSVQSLTPAVAQVTGVTNGVVVAYVAPDGSSAGLLRVGDIIEAVDEQPITDVAGLAARIGAVPAGAAVVVSVIRQGTRTPVRLTASAPATELPPANTLGLTVRVVRDVGLELMIVAPGSAAAAAGLRPGDLVSTVNGARPSQLADVTRAWMAREKSPVLLGVQRAGRPLVVALGSRDAAP
jgi:S1-C subfamily serine protease